MNKSQLGKLIWVLIYGGLLTVCVAVFVLRAPGDEGAALGWLMLTAGAVAAAAGAVLVVVRARMEEPVATRKGQRK
jgi:hypothetical protein